MKLQQGNEYIIKNYNSNINKNTKCQLLSFGLIPGAKFIIKHLTPLNKAMSVEINDFLVCLRENDLNSMHITAIQ
tara:strand:- start:8491 stop:8715 length:225 start_codon:yes stop_codon:yes gene_type:complete